MRMTEPTNTPTERITPCSEGGQHTRGRERASVLPVASSHTQHCLVARLLARHVARPDWLLTTRHRAQQPNLWASHRARTKLSAVRSSVPKKLSRQCMAAGACTRQLSALRGGELLRRGARRKKRGLRQAVSRACKCRGSARSGVCACARSAVWRSPGFVPDPAEPGATARSSRKVHLAGQLNEGAEFPLIWELVVTVIVLHVLALVRRRPCLPPPCSLEARTSHSHAALLLLLPRATGCTSSLKTRRCTRRSGPRKESESSAQGSAPGSGTPTDCTVTQLLYNNHTHQPKAGHSACSRPPHAWCGSLTSPLQRMPRAKPAAKPALEGTVVAMKPSKRDRATSYGAKGVQCWGEVPGRNRNAPHPWRPGCRRG